MKPPYYPDLLHAAQEAAGANWAALVARAGEGWEVLAQAGTLPDSGPTIQALANTIVPPTDAEGPAAIAPVAGTHAWIVPVTPPHTLILLDGAQDFNPSSPAAAVLRGIATAAAGLMEAEHLLAHARRQNADAVLLSEARRRADELDVMSRVGQAIHGTLDMEELLDRLMGEIRNVVQAEAASVLLWDEVHQSLTFSAAASPAARSLVGLRVPPGQGVAGWVAQHRQAALVSDVRTDPRWYPRVDEAIAFETRSVACVPIMRGDQLVGVLEAVNKADGPFGQHDLALLEEMSTWAGEAITNARAYALQRRRRQAAESLAQLTSIVAATLDLSQVLSRVLQQMMGVVECAEAWIALREGDELRAMAARSRQGSQTQMTPGRRFGLEVDGAAAEVLRTRGPVRQAAEAGQPARLVVPLMVGGRVIGLVAFDRLAPGYTPEEAEAVAGLAQPAAAAVENAQLYAEATRRLQEMTILHEVALATSTTLDLDELLRRTMQTLYHSLNYERVIVMLVTPGESGERLVLHTASTGLPPERLRTAVEFGQGAVGLAAQTGQPQRLEDGPSDPSFIPMGLDAPTVSQLAVPLMAGERANGVLVVESSRHAAFGTEDERLLTIVARQLATALDNSRLFEAVRRRAVNLTVLNHVARQIVGALDADEILQLAVSELSDRFVYAIATVLMLDEDGRRLTARGLAGTHAYLLPADHVWQPNGGAAGNLLRRAEMQMSQQPGGDSLFAGIPGLTIGSELAVPILQDGRALGLIAVAHAHTAAFSETDVITLEALAGLLANALRSASLYADVQARMADVRHAQDQLVQSEKFAAIGRLTASIAHEVNNPLQSIHNCLRLASEERLTPDRRAEYLDMAESELLRLMEIVRRMLEFYRPAAAEREPASVNHLVEDVLALAGKQLRDTGIELRCDFAANVPLVHVVSNHMRQVFLNLILNAIEAMPSGGRLRIATADMPDEATVRFEDTGPGISAADLGRLFEPFYTTKDRGTGLGLSVSYGIVAAHGGRIEVQSEPGSGAAFTVRLPVGEA